MSRPYYLLCRWCDRLILPFGALALVGFAQGSASETKVYTAGAIALVLVVWLVKEFLGYKDKQASALLKAAEKQTEVEQQDAKKRFDSAQEALTRETEQMGKKMTELSHAMEGIGGRGGFLSDLEMDRKRRHDLDNHVHRLTLAQFELANVVADIGQKVGVHFDVKRFQQSIDRKESER